MEAHIWLSSRPRKEGKCLTISKAISAMRMSQWGNYQGWSVGELSPSKIVHHLRIFCWTWTHKTTMKIRSDQTLILDNFRRNSSGRKGTILYWINITNLLKKYARGWRSWQVDDSDALSYAIIFDIFNYDSTKNNPSDGIHRCHEQHPTVISRLLGPWILLFPHQRSTFFFKKLWQSLWLSCNWWRVRWSCNSFWGKFSWTWCDCDRLCWTESS